MTIFLTRVVLHNYKSIAACDVRLGALTYLVGPNGAGKSNFVDALGFVRDALASSLDLALSARWGLANLLHRRVGTAAYVGIRLEFHLPNGQSGDFAFTLEAGAHGGFEVAEEVCSVGDGPDQHAYRAKHGRLVTASEGVFPSLSADRLALVSASGLPAFRPVYDALMGMGVFRFNLKALRELQQPQNGRQLKAGGENIVSVIGALKENAPDQFELVQRYLHAIVPTVHGFARHLVGPMETVLFQQNDGIGPVGAQFYANSMSDGTLRVLGALVALFNGDAIGRPSFVCIEEPETALHPAAFAAMREAIARAAESTQVLVTSHSPDLLDDFAIAPESLLAVTSVDGATRITPLEQGSRTAIKTRLFSAGELLRLNQLAPEAGSFGSHDAPLPSLWEAAPIW